MNCNEVQSLLSRYLENDLDQFIYHNISRHLQKCSDCKKELDFLSKAIAIIDAAIKVKPSR